MTRSQRVNPASKKEKLVAKMPLDPFAKERKDNKNDESKFYAQVK